MNLFIHGPKPFVLASRQADKNVCKIAYSFYFRIFEITETQTSQILIRSQILVNWFKNQLLHTLAETVRFFLEADKKSNTAYSFPFRNLEITNKETFKSE